MREKAVSELTRLLSTWRRRSFVHTMMAFFATKASYYVPLINIRRMLFVTILCTFSCVLLSYISHTKDSSSKKDMAMGRELLQQELPDYISETTALIPKLMEMKHILDTVNTSPVSEKEILSSVLKSSNIPLLYRRENHSQMVSNGSACSRFPSVYDLDFNNIYWQKAKIFNVTFYLFNAYYDERKGVGSYPLVRIIGMIDAVHPPKSFCQFWYNNGSKSTNDANLIFSKVEYTYMWYHKWGNYKDGILQPFIMSCRVPKNLNKSHVPDSVSLVTKRCEKISNNIRVIYKKPEKRQNFAVCVKGLDFLYEDISVRLVEWIELLNILGAEKIFLYELEVHPNISKVLSHYIQNGLVELAPLTLPGQQPNLPGFRHLYLKSKLINKRQNELIPYNDCLYRNLYSYKYLALLDTDEVIMPLVHEDWRHLMEGLLTLAKKEKIGAGASYNFRNVYFLDDLQDGKELMHNTHEEGIPPYLHMLQHVHRSKNYTKPGSYVKCFHDVDRVVSLHNHFPMHCFGQCSTYSVNTSIAHLQHYRKDCVDPLRKACTEFRNHTVRDTSIWRFKNELIRRTTETLTHLKFF